MLTGRFFQHAQMAGPGASLQHSSAALRRSGVSPEPTLQMSGLGFQGTFTQRW